MWLFFFELTDVALIVCNDGNVLARRSSVVTILHGAMVTSLLNHLLKQSAAIAGGFSVYLVHTICELHMLQGSATPALLTFCGDR
jgi:hypothetical protein